MDKVERTARIIFRGMEDWDYGPTTWEGFGEDNRAYILKVARAVLLVADAEDTVADRMVATYFQELDASEGSETDQSDIDRALAAMAGAAKSAGSAEP
jgi:hypothetical protein